MSDRQKPNIDRTSGSRRKSRLAEQLRGNLSKRKALQRSRTRDEAAPAADSDTRQREDEGR